MQPDGRAKRNLELDVRHTEATKKKLSEMRRGSRNPFYGRKHTEEFKRKQSERTRAFNASRQYEAYPQSIVVPTDAAVLAYLAGMIDADGSIRFSGGRPFVAIYNTHQPLIEWLLETLQYGSVANGNKGREQVVAWRITAARDVFSLITAIMPYLIVKRSDAQAALDFINGKYEWARTPQ